MPAAASDAVPVETGISDDYNVEIKSGVEEEMEVFTTARPPPEPGKVVDMLIELQRRL